MSNTFQGKLIRLRAHEPGEESIYREWVRQDPDSGRMGYEIGFPIPLTPPATPSPAEETKPHDGDNFPFTIEVLDNGAIAGAIHIHHANQRCGTFMYGINIFRDYQRKGYAHEAIRLALGYYFDERRYQKCNVEVYSFNEASIRLHERLGFMLEGRLRRMVYTNGTFHDTLVYGITDEEFRLTHHSHPPAD